MGLVKGINIGDRVINRWFDSHADWSAAFTNLYNYEIIGASALGKLHIRNKTPRDDAFAIKSSGEWLAVAVSDGLGSHKKSRYGSTFAVQVLTESLLNELYKIDTTALPQNSTDTESPVEKKQNKKLFKHFSLKKLFNSHSSKKKQDISICYNFEIHHTEIEPQKRPVYQMGSLQWYDKELYDSVVPVSPLSLNRIMKSAFKNTHNQLRSYTRHIEAQINEIGCTLLGMLFNLKTGDMVVGQVGDGLIAALGNDDKSFPLVESDIPEEGGSATYIITKSDWEKHFTYKEFSGEKTKDFKTIFLMSDGVENDCTNPPPEDIFTRWANGVDKNMRKDISSQEKAAMLLNWLANYEAPASWDDRTLVVILKENTSLQKNDEQK